MLSLTVENVLKRLHSETHETPYPYMDMVYVQSLLTLEFKYIWMPIV